MTKTLRGISLFSGAGGLDLGLEAAGFPMAVRVDFDERCKETLQSNQGKPVLCRDIADVATDELLQHSDATVGEIDLLAGGPPCQPFSKSGYWARTEQRPGGLGDHRADGLRHFLRVLEETLPRAYLLENVYGFIYDRKAHRGRFELPVDYLRRYLDAIEARTGARYSLSVKLINTADFGIPQIRERVFVVGFRDGHEFCWPARTHYNPEGERRITLEERLRQALSDSLNRPLSPEVRDEHEQRLKRFGLASATQDCSQTLLAIFDELEELESENTRGLEESSRYSRDDIQPWRTAWDAIGDLDTDREPEPEEVVAGKWGHLLPYIPEGFNYLYFTDKLRAHPALFKWRSRYWTFLLKLARTRPSSTIQAQPGPYVGPFHWRNRRLSVLELKRLMTFPDEYQIRGSRRDIQRQLGNAVPPLIARVLGEAIREQLTVPTLNHSLVEVASSTRIGEFGEPRRVGQD